MEKNYVSCGGDRHPESGKGNDTGTTAELSLQRDLPDGYVIELHSRADGTASIGVLHKTSFSGGFADLPFSMEWNRRIYEMIRDRRDFYVIQALCLRAEKPSMKEEKME